MRIFLPIGQARDGSAYLAEILHACGLCFTERCSLHEALQRADPQRDLMLLPHGSDTEGIESFLSAGGSVVAVAPDARVEALAGLVRTGSWQGPSRLRLTQPVCYGARGEPLWTLGQVHTFEPRHGGGVSGYLFREDDPRSETVGIVECPVGAGRLVVYAYDPALCIVRLRQGFPEKANFLPSGLPTPRAIFLQQPDQPPDSLWRPTADLHAFTLCEILLKLLSRQAPVPSLWLLPDANSSILLFSGDEDASEQDANDQQMRDLESFGGAMSLYVIPDNSSIAPDKIDDYVRRGHTISVHPDLLPTAGRPVAEQLARAEEQLDLFREKFDLPVRTLRNHHYMWPGYLDLPELWERRGIGMDANACATLYGISLESGPFTNVHAGIPLRFVREDGSLIDVFSQPTHINDDLVSRPIGQCSEKLSPEQFDWVVQRMFDDSMRFFHVPLCANFHPCNYVSFSGEHGRVLMRRAQEYGVPIWSLDRWHDFWRARSSWRMTGHAWDGARLRVEWCGAPCEGLVVTLPAAVEQRELDAIELDGSPVTWQTARRHGHVVCLVALPAESSEAVVEAAYRTPEANAP